MKAPFYCLLSIALLSFSPLWAKDNLETMEKLKTIRLPKVDFWEITFSEAIEIIRIQAHTHDPDEDPRKKGVNFVMRDVRSDRPVTLTLTNARLGSVLHKLCKISGNSMKIDKYAVIFTRVQE